MCPESSNRGCYYLQSVARTARPAAFGAAARDGTGQNSAASNPAQAPASER